MKDDRHRRAANGVVASYMHERSDRHRPSREPSARPNRYPSEPSSSRANKTRA